MLGECDGFAQAQRVRFGVSSLRFPNAMHLRPTVESIRKTGFAAK